MKSNRLLIVIAVLVSLMLACNVSIGDTTAPPTAAVVVVTQLVPADTATPQPEATGTDEPQPTDEATATAGPTSTASAPMVTPLKDPVNCRFGPSILFEQEYALQVGAYMPVVGKSADKGWWLVGIPGSNNQACWVGASVTTITGDQSGIQTVAAPQAFITDVKLQISPDLVNLGSGCANIPSDPFSITAFISANGPLEIVWHVETQQGGSVSTSDHSLKFEKFGTQKVSFNFVPGGWKKGNFWIRIVITSPKSMASDVTYQVKCQ